VWNRSAHVMGDVHTDIVAQKVDPSGIFAVNGVLELCNGCAPLALGQEGNVWRSVVYKCECAHPKMETQKGDKPEFNDAPHSNKIKHDWEEKKREIINSSKAALHFVYFVFFERGNKEVLMKPVPNATEEPQRASCNFVTPLS